eukprot:TRINITY_DN5027_c0_g1_i1.p1 TRINITY_DN5027_c0_g1~~TRINITY_DN5027_c0_g1_i1.p1  ORF type:complete len:403 (+),score=128.23 TRINITY_DN5027_c0_g1_i1:37-1209(+)
MSKADGDDVLSRRVDALGNMHRVLRDEIAELRSEIRSLADVATLRNDVAALKELCANWVADCRQEAMSAIAREAALLRDQCASSTEVTEAWKKEASALRADIEQIRKDMLSSPTGPQGAGFKSKMSIVSDKVQVQRVANGCTPVEAAKLAEDIAALKTGMTEKVHSMAGDFDRKIQLLDRNVSSIFETIEQQISGGQTAIAKALDKELTAMKTSCATMQYDAAQLQILRTDLTEVQTTMTKVKEDRKQVLLNIAGLKGQVEGTFDVYAALQKEVTQVQQDVTRLDKYTDLIGKTANENRRAIKSYSEKPALSAQTVTSEMSSLRKMVDSQKREITNLQKLTSQSSEADRIAQSVIKELKANGSIKKEVGRIARVEAICGVCWGSIWVPLL